MMAPTRALVVEDIDTWVYTLSRAARRAGVSEVVPCSSVHEVAQALRTARFDIAILDIGLDPDDDLNAGGIEALELIRKADGGGTRCVLVTGWQGGDRLDLQSRAQYQYGVDWAFMKEKYEAHLLIPKLTELLEGASAQRLSVSTPMENLAAGSKRFEFEDQLMRVLAPAGGVATIYTLLSRLLSPAVPLVAMDPESAMTAGPGGGLLGLYWSRSLRTAVAVGLGPANSPSWDAEDPPMDLPSHGRGDMTAELIERVKERNLRGSLWELPELSRDEFPG
jgi:CheY-like chemotaxis protein